MSNNVPPLNMSSVIAFVEKRTNRNNITLDYLKRNDPSLSHIDWAVAEKWENIINSTNDNNSFDSICREFCLGFVNSRPYLLKLASHGRDSILSNLNSDELQVFRVGKLLEKLPDADIVSWWDNLRILANAKFDEGLIAQGRIAEGWTIEEEKKILREFCSRIPEWVALDSDHYGYDILSYRMVEGDNILPIQIEVKSYQSPMYPHFYITRNEWERAKQAGDAYHYYIWCIHTRKYQKLYVGDIFQHIPEDSGYGKWQTVLIEL